MVLCGWCDGGSQGVGGAQQAQGLKYQYHAWGPGPTWQGAGTLQASSVALGREAELCAGDQTHHAWLSLSSF